MIDGDGSLDKAILPVRHDGRVKVMRISVASPAGPSSKSMLIDSLFSFNPFVGNYNKALGASA